MPGVQLSNGIKGDLLAVKYSVQFRLSESAERIDEINVNERRKF